MLFISNAAALLEKNAIIAAQRMFLFSDDVSIPTDTTSLADMISRINKSRGFCAKINEDKTMSCVRSAGWKGGRLYYNYAPSVKPVSTTTDTTVESKQISMFELFSRYYSIGRKPVGSTYYQNSGSALDNIAHDPISAPVQNVMMLPPYDGTALNALSRQLIHTPNVGLSYNTQWSGTDTTSLGIVTKRWTRTYQTVYTYLNIKAVDYSAMSATLSKASYSLSGTEYTTDIATVGPRLFMAYNQYGEVSTNSSGTFLGSTTSFTPGPYTTTQNVSDNNILYGQGSKADTGEYAISWGMMPVVGEKESSPMIAMIFKAGDDFTQAGTTEPGTKPNISIKDIPALNIRAKFIV